MTRSNVSEKAPGNWTAVLSIEDKDGCATSIQIDNIATRDEAVALLQEKQKELEEIRDFNLSKMPYVKNNPTLSRGTV